MTTILASPSPGIETAICLGAFLSWLEAVLFSASAERQNDRESMEVKAIACRKDRRKLVPAAEDLVESLENLINRVQISPSGIYSVSNYVICDYSIDYGHS